MVLDLQRERPASRDGLVQRSRLVARLRSSREASLVAVIAPAGYGKTSLLREWLEAEGRSSVWITLGRRHNDPAHLLGDVEGAIADLDDGDILVLDDLHVLDRADALGTMVEIAEHLPEGLRLALASRTEPPLRFGHLRAHHAVCELRLDDLAMDRAEASELLRLTGLDLSDSAVESLRLRTEGWPAGLYLAALSLQDQDDLGAALERFAGDDHVVLEYLRDEYLGELAPAAMELLTRSAILPKLHGALCEALLQHDGATVLLEELARGNLLLSPLDRSHEWYRVHPLLREALLRELRRADPQGTLSAELHRRASAWHADHGDLDSSIQHAVLAGDASRAGELIWENLPRYVTHGRNPEVQCWLEHFSSTQIAAEPALAAVAAHSSLASGDIRMAEHWGLAAAGSLARAVPPPSVASLPAGVAIIEAAVGRHGVLPMGRDAARAYQLEPQDSPWRSLCCLFLGVSDHLVGDRALAREHLEEGVHRSAPQAPNVEALCLVQLATITAEEGDWQTGAELVERAVTQVDGNGLGAYPTSALVFAVSAAVRSHIGYVDEGKRDLHRATRLMAMLNDFIPWYAAETRIALARAALQLADIRLARTLLAEASHLARRVPDATVFRAWLDEIWEQVDTAAASTLSGSAALTMAELRILRFLPTHLSFREIGLRLHVSTNTVKTQAHAVYRKLGVCTRSQAVTRAGEIGLIDA